MATVIGKVRKKVKKGSKPQETKPQETKPQE